MVRAQRALFQCFRKGCSQVIQVVMAKVILTNNNATKGASRWRVMKLQPKLQLYSMYCTNSSFKVDSRFKLGSTHGAVSEYGYANAALVQ